MLADTQSSITAIWQAAEAQAANGTPLRSVAAMLGLLPAAFKVAVKCRAQRGLWKTPIASLQLPANPRDDKYARRLHRRDEIAACLPTGGTAAQIAKRLNVPVSYVYLVAKQRGHSFRRQLQWDWPEIEARFQSGEPLNSIAQGHNISHSTLWKSVKQQVQLGLWKTPLKRPKPASVKDPQQPATDA